MTAEGLCIADFAMLLTMLVGCDTVAAKSCRAYVLVAVTLVLTVPAPQALLGEPSRKPWI